MPVFHRAFGLEAILLCGLLLGVTRAETISLADLLAQANARNPGLAAARAIRQAKQLGRAQVTSLPDPRLVWGEYLREVETRVGAQRRTLGFQQLFPTGGKLSLQGRIADLQAEEAWEDLQDRRLEIARELHRTYYEYWFNRRSREITREMMELLASGERVARTRYASGRGGQEVLIKAQVELGMLEDRVRSLEEMERTFVESVNRLLDREPGTPLGDPDPADLEEAEVTRSREELERLLESRAPRLRRLQVQAQRKRSEASLAAKARIPDVTLGVQWMPTDSALVPTRDSGKDPLLVSLGINLPFHPGRIRAAQKAREFERTAVLEEHADLENRLAENLEAILFRYQDGRRKLSLYRDSLVPKGRQSLEATFASFQSGRASFLDLLDAERVLLDFELSLARGTKDHLMAIADLERLVGAGISRRVGAPTGHEFSERKETP